MRHIVLQHDLPHFTGASLAQFPFDKDPEGSDLDPTSSSRCIEGLWSQERFVAGHFYMLHPPQNVVRSVAVNVAKV